MTDSKSRIAVFHLSINACGGAEALALTLCRALTCKGHAVTLVTTERTDWSRVKKTLGFGRDVCRNEIVIPPFVRLPTIYSKFVYWLVQDVIFGPILRRKFTLTITTLPTLPIAFSDILYMHFPDFVPIEHLRIYPKYASGVLRAYSIPYESLCLAFVKAARHMRRRATILTNSTYSSEAIEKYLRVKPVVVYPPVDIEKYRALARLEKRDHVLTIARLTEGKNTELIPELAKSVPNARFILMGSTQVTSIQYAARILDKAKQLGVEKRFNVVPDANMNEKIRIMSSAKIYLHTTISEHFGIAVVEAMSAGLVPVVHRSGGPWLDILDRTQGRYGFSYENSEEAAVIIEHLLNDDDLTRRLSVQAAKRADSFSQERFEERILDIITHASNGAESRSS
jgi:alpha-1,2-mannosyltransferase